VKQDQQVLWAWFAGLLPLLGLCALVAKAEVAVRHGPTFRVPIRGYDPRDLIHGQYLRYSFEFDLQGEDDCRAQAWQNEVAPMRGESDPSDCCLCLTRSTADGFNPSVRRLACTTSQPSCDGWIVEHNVSPPLSYFVPEDKADALQRALNDADTARPSIEFTLPRDGTLAIKELYLGDAPWREALTK
jgi:uncharacterized membrane-anchored protein